MERYGLAVLERPGLAPLYALWDRWRGVQVCGWDHRRAWIEGLVRDNNARWQCEQSSTAPGEVRLVG